MLENVGRYRQRSLKLVSLLLTIPQGWLIAPLFCAACLPGREGGDSGLLWPFLVLLASELAISHNPG